MKLKNLSRPKVEWGPIWSPAHRRAEICAYVAALISQALIDRLQIIQRYNHRTKRCCVLSQDDGTSSSDRRAIECPKTRQRSHVINGSFEVSAPAPPSSFFLERRREELPHAAPFLGGHRFAMFATAGQ
jgi:hypothetical protein